MLSIDEIKEYISKKDIEKKIKELGRAISKDYKGKDIEVICVLKGAAIFTVELSMHIKPNGNARDHGYLMKIDEKNLELLFPKPKEYNLETDSFDDF